MIIYDIRFIKSLKEKKTKDYLKAIRAWEEELTQYEEQSTEVVPDSIKITTLTQKLVDDKMREHLILNATQPV